MSEEITQATANTDSPISEPFIVEDSIWEFANGKFTRKLPEDPGYLIYDFPTVYICAADEHTHPKSFMAYVGETNNIRNRTSQHLIGDAAVREDWAEFRDRADEDPESVRQYVIGHEHFNKSLTLDVENRMMHYLMGVSSVKSLNNRRTNPQGNYYTRSELDEVFSRAWAGLHKRNSSLFPSEQDVKNSALFKASPFHSLSDGQMRAERQILDAVVKARELTDEDLPLGAYGKLIVVQGAAGTGKTVVLSHLFNTLMSGVSDDDDEGTELEISRPDAYLLISHKEQRSVYNQIAVKLGLQKKEDEVVLNPVSFLNRHSKKKTSKNGKNKTTDFDAPSDRVDIALIDEAHLLATQSGQAWQGKSVLLDVMRRAKVTIAVFDPAQILESAQRWNEEDLNALLGEDSGKGSGGFAKVKITGGTEIDRMSVVLEEQFRIAASKEVVAWIDNLVDGRGIGPLPQSDEYFLDGKLVREPYELRVFDSPVELFDAIREKANDESDESEEGRGLSRVLATYDWDYSSGSASKDDPRGLWNVQMHRDASGQWLMGLEPGDARGYIAGDNDPDRFCHPWNYGLSPQGGKGIDGDAWAERAATLEEVGSTFTIQGFDLNYAGVIIGPSVKLREGKLVFDAKASKSKKATNKRDKVDYSAENLHNELNVLLKRGVHGLYLFAVDPELQAALKRAANGEVGFAAKDKSSEGPINNGAFPETPL